MSESKEGSGKGISVDWLVRGILVKFGDVVDQFTGRKWTPSSSLATSELAARLKLLLDAEAISTPEGLRIVPHNLQLKVQWDKFATDSEADLAALSDELHVAAIDHINDQRYHTYAPLTVRVTPDYFTEGVKLISSFEQFAPVEREVELRVTVPDVRVGDYLPEEPAVVPPTAATARSFEASFAVRDLPKTIRLEFKPKERRTVGRGRENDLLLDDVSVSKIHASLALNEGGGLIVADTGSTNGTFVGGERIAYGRAVEVGNGSVVRFGNVNVTFRVLHDASPETGNDSTVVAQEQS